MRTVSLSDVVKNVQAGFASGDDDERGIVQVRMNNVTTDGALLWTKIRRVPRPKNIDRMLAEPGDILFNATNSPELVGKSALFIGYDEPVTFSNHFIRLRFDPSVVHSAFVIRVLQDRWAKRVFTGLCKQWVNQASVSREDLLALKIPLPPLSEQRDIAAILDQADELRRKRRRAIEMIDQVPQAVFEQMFGGSRALSEAWPQITLADIVRDDDQINYGVVQPGSDCEAGIPLVRVANIVNNDFSADNLKKIDPNIEAQYRQSRLHGDEILVACVGSIGAVTLATSQLAGANIARAVARVRVNERKVDRVYAAEFLRLPRTQHYFRAETRTVAQPTLNIKQLCETPFLLPPINLQKEFARNITVTDRVRSLSVTHLHRVNALFASLEYRGFRGELTFEQASPELEIAG